MFQNKMLRRESTLHRYFSVLNQTSLTWSQLLPNVALDGRYPDRLHILNHFSAEI